MATRARKFKKNKNGPSDVRGEIRQIGVLVERVDDHVNLIAEQYGDIKKELNAHGAMLESHGEILASHGAILESHGEMIGKLAIDIAIIKEDAAFIKNGLKRKIDIEEFAALERRVTLLEKKI